MCDDLSAPPGKPAGPVSHRPRGAANHRPAGGSSRHLSFQPDTDHYPLADITIPTLVICAVDDAPAPHTDARAPSRSLAHACWSSSNRHHCSDHRAGDQRVAPLPDRHNTAAGGVPTTPPNKEFRLTCSPFATSVVYRYCSSPPPFCGSPAFVSKGVSTDSALGNYPDPGTRHQGWPPPGNRRAVPPRRLVGVRLGRARVLILLRVPILEQWVKPHVMGG